MANIYDYPASLIPAEQLFRTPAAATLGGFTTKGAAAMFPSPGGRAILDFNYGGPLFMDGSQRLYSWLLSKIGNGTVFRLPLWWTKQMVSSRDLELDDGSLDQNGLSWANGQPWSDGQNWAFEPGVGSMSAALEGTMVVRGDFGALPKALGHGHVIGHKDRAYVVDDIEWDGVVAEITLSMPLRVDVKPGDFLTFRPRMLGVCQDPDRFKGMYGSANIVRPGSITFIEALI